MDTAKLDENGNVIRHPRNIYLFYTVEVVRWFALLALWGGATTVIVSVFPITPATANGRGWNTLVTDTTVPVLYDKDSFSLHRQ